jgi:hypothetical protein
MHLRILQTSCRFALNCKLFVMIQRIQSLFLFIALACCAACYFLPFWIYTGINPAYEYQVSLFSVSLVSGSAIPNFYVGTLPIIVIVSISTILSVVTLFYYKKRQMQLKINNYNILMTVIFTGTIFLLIPYMIEEMLPDAIRTWQYGLLLPLISLVFLILAGNFIKKDEKLVKSADRLR